MKQGRLFRVLLPGALALGAALLALTVFSPGARLPDATACAPLTLTGEYTLGDSQTRLPFDGRSPVSAAALTTLTVYGHFDRDVPAHEQVVMRIPNLRVALWVNGAEVFTYGERRLPFLKTEGHAWAAFASAGISTADTVELRLQNVYANDTLCSFDAFFASLASGSEYRAYQAALRESGWGLALAAIIMLLGLMMLCVSVYGLALHVARAAEYAYLSAFVLASGLWTGIDYRAVSLLAPYPAFWQTLEMLCMAFLPVFLMRYIRPLLLPGRCRAAGTVAMYGALLLAVLGTTLQLLGVVDLPELTVVFVASDTAGIAVVTVCLIAALAKHAAPDTRSEAWPLFILFGGSLLNFANYLFSWQTGGLFYALAFLAFSLLEMLRLVGMLRLAIRRNSEYARLENELTQSRIAVMLSQIKPHFLFNALNAISALCLTDPIMADQAITSLSNYLRGNIRSLEQTEPVPFERELDHIKYYVRLEQLRYGDKLRVVYAIGAVDFTVPTLSLQTLVENAIRHGVSPKPEGGLVVVQTEREPSCAVVRIIDNGVGFDPDMQSRNADSIGLANAKKRMEAMMGATLQIKSLPGKGTTITIRIPDAKGGQGS